MHILDDITQLEPGAQAACLTIGNFDGVHRGHRALVQRLTDESRRRNGLSIAMTFEPHPVRFFKGSGHPPFRLTAPQQRAAYLEALGLDVLLVLPFTADLAHLSPDAFVRELVCDYVGAEYVLVGYDFNFGRGRSGSPQTLVTLGKTHGFDAEAFGPFELDGKPVSSSRIRHCVRAGAVEEAADLLGRPFTMGGKVIRGEARGRELGFPTANMLPGDLICPTPGIYVTHLVRADTGERLPGVTNVGVRPTFDDTRGTLIETFVLDAPAELNLYDLQVEIEFLSLLRPEERFDDVDALVAQMHRDVANARAAHGSVG